LFRAVPNLMEQRLNPLYEYQVRWTQEAEQVRRQAKEEHDMRAHPLKKQRRDAFNQRRAAEFGGYVKATNTSSSSGDERGSKDSSWDRWWPWFRSDCSFCRKEVEELLEEEQQQQQQSSSSPAGGTAAAAAGPAYYPWQETQQQQQTSEPLVESTEAAAGAGGGGGEGASEPLLHDSVYGAWPVPWDCPFRFRRLMWRLMARVKPMALEFLAEQFGMCAHCGEGLHWKTLVRGQGCGVWVGYLGGFLS
jgi:hypothetical protein